LQARPRCVSVRPSGRAPAASRRAPPGSTRSLQQSIVWMELNEYRSSGASSGPMRAQGHEVNRQTTVVVVTLLVSFLGSAPPAQAQPTVTASDSNDVADRLDIRFATLPPSPETGRGSRSRSGMTCRPRCWSGARFGWS
jgi:hypothetical protein